MKTFLKGTLAAALLLTLCSGSAFAQKFGYINIQELVSTMPEIPGLEANLQTFGQDLQEQLEAMQVEHNIKFEDYLANTETWTDVVRNSKEKEITDLRTRIQEFEQNAYQSLEEEQRKLLAPIYQKATEAIQKVARTNNLAAVFEAGVMHYMDESTMINILPLVQAELGIQPQ